MVNYLFNENSILSKNSIFLSNPDFSILNDVYDPFIIEIFLKITIIFCLLMMVGLFSRFSTLLTLIGIVSIKNHEVYSNFCSGGAVLLCNILLFLCFSNSGSAFSLDRWIKIKLGYLNKDNFEKIPLWPKNLIGFQVFSMYVSCVFFKLLDPAWLNGRGVYYAFKSQYSMNSLPDFLTLPPFTVIATYGTILLEIFIPFSFINRKWMKYALPLGVLLHSMMYYCLNIGIFSLAVICSYTALLSDKDYAEIFKRMKMVKFLFKRKLEEVFCVEVARLH